MRLIVALAAAAAGYCYYKGLEARRAVRPREDITRWENEGGNVPSVATPSATAMPSPSAAASPYTPGDPVVRH